MFADHRHAEKAGLDRYKQLRQGVGCETDHWMSAKRFPGNAARGPEIPAVAHLNIRINMARIGNIFGLCRSRLITVVFGKRKAGEECEFESRVALEEQDSSRHGAVPARTPMGPDFLRRP